MPAFRILQVILIAALCLGFISLHGTLGATVYLDRHCPSVIEPDHHASGIASPPVCCTKSQCCAVPVTFVRAPTIHSPHLRSAHAVQAKAFLLVRALYPPPKTNTLPI